MKSVVKVFKCIYTTIRCCYIFNIGINLIFLFYYYKVKFIKNYLTLNTIHFETDPMYYVYEPMLR